MSSHDRFLRPPFGDLATHVTDLQVASALLAALEKAQVHRHSDYMVYTGSLGLVWLYLHLHLTQAAVSTDKPFLDKAWEVFDSVQKPPSDAIHRVSFLGSPVGYHALGAVLSHYQHKENLIASYFSAMCAVYHDAEDASDELLYGEAGFLYSLAFVRHHLGPDHAVLKNYDSLASQVISTIFEDGIAGATEKWPLMWNWHDSPYLGAAHGIAGILTLLLRHHQLLSTEQQTLLQQTLRMTLQLPQLTPRGISATDARLPSGNWKSSLGRERDILVQWCHGAPGFVPLLVLAKSIYSEPALLQELDTALLQACDVIKERGILKKGVGLCHGIAGNGYALLLAAQETRNAELIEAVKLHASLIRKWTMDESWRAHNFSTPDHPWSLFEGIGGAICFLADISTGQPIAGFPCMSDV